MFVEIAPINLKQKNSIKSLQQSFDFFFFVFHIRTNEVFINYKLSQNIFVINYCQNIFFKHKKNTKIC